MSQLPVLSKSKSINCFLWNYTGKVNNKYADMYFLKIYNNLCSIHQMEGH